MVLSGGVPASTTCAGCAGWRAPNVDGVIVGRALYEKTFSLAEAMAVLRQAGAC